MRLLSIFGNDLAYIMKAFDRSQAIISFTPDGKILDANENFCKAIGYTREEIVGKNHRMFIDPKEAQLPEYKAFWKRLADGEYDQRQYKRIGKGGKEIWIEASYNPVIRGGKVVKVVKIATEITASKHESLESKGKLDALSRAQAIIEFMPDGKILTANKNFLETLGYTLEEIVGKHHGIFCEPDFVASREYSEFWTRLAKGEYYSDEFKRIRKDGSPVYIQATYNPILDEDGNVFKVVKFATDVSGRVLALQKIGSGLERLSDCNIRVTIDEPFVEEFEHLRHDFNESLAKFQETLEEVLSQTTMLSSKSGDMSESANGIAQRSEQQAAALEETSAALEEITVTVRESVGRTAEARDLVRDARSAASKSVQIVNSTVNAMGRIEAASREITNIIDVIDQISFQTNLLALNAGVEAARAGDAGKGFAVVAQEVRELAQRSTKAAKEIAVLIGNSSNAVKDGVRLVGETGDALKSIEGYVQSIDANIDGIALASSEQSTSLNEINSAVNSLDQMTQQNAGMVSSMGTIAEAVASDAAGLEALVKRFKLNRREWIREPGSEAAKLGPESRGYGKNTIYQPERAHQQTKGSSKVKLAS
ncbi:methyl-accepting chemotaxis protein [Allorhizobium ampelinum]|uniref:methyl-accepting chemotaxis protein n=1 Tax=Allorhizobium ampelinum TaxID=3025782 RepID=UPI000B404B45|nr:PAS domain-containing methyl-accepting chemotaxis protein [Allorhizobium ampelinum]NTA29902.1 PAS domain S-box protein [Allorhizobium ampelinum]OVE87513.1 chemotaxis protein [Allorhizobium ampelinum]